MSFVHVYLVIMDIWNGCFTFKYLGIIYAMGTCELCHSCFKLAMIWNDLRYIGIWLWAVNIMCALWSMWMKSYNLWHEILCTIYSWNYWEMIKDVHYVLDMW